METQKSNKSTGVLVGTILGLILLIVAYEQLTLSIVEPDISPVEGEKCQGEPLYVDYAYEGDMVAPHACLEQCKDTIWRHIVYTNDKATQCQKPPGCSDQGEDRGITCAL